MALHKIIKFWVSVCALLTGTFLYAQDQESAFVDRLRNETCKISLDYTVTTQDGFEVVGEGVLIIQDDKYNFTTASMEVRADGSSVWIADHSIKEVVIESYNQESTSYLNPAIAFQGIISGEDSAFKKVFENGQLKEIEVDLKEMDGILLNISVHSYDFISKLPDQSAFGFSESYFDSSWVVTDLR